MAIFNPKISRSSLLEAAIVSTLAFLWVKISETSGWIPPFSIPYLENFTVTALATGPVFHLLRLWARRKLHPDGDASWTVVAVGLLIPPLSIALSVALLSIPSIFEPREYDHTRWGPRRRGGRAAIPVVFGCLGFYISLELFFTTLWGILTLTLSCLTCRVMLRPFPSERTLDE